MRSFSGESDGFGVLIGWCLGVVAPLVTEA